MEIDSVRKVQPVFKLGDDGDDDEWEDEDDWDEDEDWEDDESSEEGD
ncbi:hypothetical protein HY995_01510 [Candidatus Micrarchaeota archaeon]|nr:hypothetical protein [Candidatus Micrarchaeota archaeon]